MMKQIRTNNYKLRNINNCPMCNSKLYIEYNLDISFILLRKIKNFIWKKYYIKNDKESDIFNYDNNIPGQPISMSMCGNYGDGKKILQNKKIVIKKVFGESRKDIKQTCSHIYCGSCVYSKFIENISYLEVLREK